MKKIEMILFLAVATVLLSGCGTWCSINREYCVQGFSGFNRYPGGMYTSAYYYPESHLTIVNNVKKRGCYLEVKIDGRLMAGKIERGEDKYLAIANPPDEDRWVSVLVKEYCGKDKFVDSYEHAWAVSSRRQVSETWRMTDNYFPLSLPPHRWVF